MSKGILETTEKKTAIRIQLPDQVGEIEPVPTDAHGGRGEPELDRLSIILKAFNDQFGNIKWTDNDRVRKLVTEEIPAKVAADKAYQNAKKNSDMQNARIEHDKALKRVMTAVLKDDAELYKQFSDNPDFRRWLTDMVFTKTYDEVAGTGISSRSLAKRKPFALARNRSGAMASMRPITSACRRSTRLNSWLWVSRSAVCI